MINITSTRQLSTQVYGVEGFATTTFENETLLRNNEGLCDLRRKIPACLAGKFTRNFKLEPVRLIKERGVSYAQAALDLGVHQSALRDWVKGFEADP
jgi:hypothetical protein